MYVHCTVASVIIALHQIFYNKEMVEYTTGVFLQTREIPTTAGQYAVTPSPGLVEYRISRASDFTMAFA